MVLVSYAKGATSRLWGRKSKGRSGGTTCLRYGAVHEGAKGHLQGTTPEVSVKCTF